MVREQESLIVGVYESDADKIERNRGLDFAERPVITLDPNTRLYSVQGRNNMQGVNRKYEPTHVFANYHQSLLRDERARIPVSSVEDPIGFVASEGLVSVVKSIVYHEFTGTLTDREGTRLQRNANEFMVYGGTAHVVEIVEQTTDDNTLLLGVGSQRGIRDLRHRWYQLVMGELDRSLRAKLGSGAEDASEDIEDASDDLIHYACSLAVGDQEREVTLRSAIMNGEVNSEFLEKYAQDYVFGLATAEIDARRKLNPSQMGGGSGAMRKFDGTQHALAEILKADAVELLAKLRSGSTVAR